MLPSFLPVSPHSDFPLNNLPYGVISTASDPRPRPAVAIGEHALDLRAAHRAGLLAGPLLSQAGSAFEQVGAWLSMKIRPPRHTRSHRTLHWLLLGATAARLRSPR